MRGADPAIVLVPGVGMFSFGADKQTARVAGEFYLNAINVMRGAEAISTYAPIPESEKFRIEYWELEEAKLRRRPAPKPLAGRVAFVTGGGSGIGRATAERLAAEGACVVVADRDAGAAARWPAEIGSADVAVAVTADVTSEADVAAAFAAAALAFGGVDLVVNNAGLSISKPLAETSVADWDLLHDVMARGSFLVSRSAAAMLEAQGLGGDIVYIVSKNAVFAGPSNVAYGAAKADQAHQVRLLAAELGAIGVRVNGINPDGVVRGSGIFSAGWGASRAAVYGVPESELGAFYASADPAEARGAARARRGRRVRAVRRRPAAHDRPAHPRRRGRGGGVLAMTRRSVGSVVVAGVDLGASGGRVLAARVSPDGVSLHEVSRFPNEPVLAGGTLHWDILRLYSSVVSGLRSAAASFSAGQRRDRLVGRGLRAARFVRGAGRQPGALPGRSDGRGRRCRCRLRRCTR